MSGSIEHQLELVRALDAYERAERITSLFADPGIIGQTADRLHERLTLAAMLCDFRPANEHRGLSVVEFARRRAARIALTLPNNLREAGL